MAPPELPLDIWWLVCKELTDRRDFYSLFSLALSSRTAASLALPNLYSIHDLAPTSTDGSPNGKRKLVTLWRGIILSSMEKTAFPYCLWIKTLKLGELSELLSDIAFDRDLRDAFLGGDMKPFDMERPMTVSRMKTRQTQLHLNVQGISDKAGSAITLFVEEATARDNKAVGLTHLEGQYIPMDLLPVWTSRLASLMTLHIQDGSVIGEEVATSIRQNCPNFRELVCFYCDGPTVDEDLAAFFTILEPTRSKCSA